jgi:hypothetical protein
MAGSIASFPRNGKNFRRFSTQWIKGFHSMGKRALRREPRFPRAREVRRPLTVRDSRPPSLTYYNM